MHCRLCLQNIEEEVSISVFQKTYDSDQIDFQEIIVNYFQLQLSTDDPISTSICLDCCEHLKVFHAFWTHIQQKQSTLHPQHEEYEFINVKCRKSSNLLTTFDVLTSVDDGGHNLNLNEPQVDPFESPSLLNKKQTDFTSDNKNDVVCFEKETLETQCREANITDAICTVCNKRLCSRKYLKVHMRTIHDAKTITKCHLCFKKISGQNNFQTHLKRHREKVEMQSNCAQCKRSFSSIKRLKLHCQVMHAIEYPFKCTACDESFACEQELISHKNLCKKPKLLQKDQSGMKKEFACEICHKNFLNAQRLRNHIAAVHENIYPHICEQCGKKFKFKPSFERHLLQHAGIVEPPAQCTICFDWLKNKDSLRRHRYAHDGTIHECQLCDHKAPTRSALLNHVNFAHRQKRNIKCRYCKKLFKDKKSLTEHVAIHTDVQLYSCPHCSKETRSSSNMYAHVKRMHPDEWWKATLSRSNNPTTVAELYQ